ncbi:MAG: FKBP-type peptidyl-prolyl cis-trans isomerase [Bacteroidales bacterium]|nr:FKBP-type peptidyl-prolyl cis-trans isomerase [Bacteroidales bacterium]
MKVLQIVLLAIFYTSTMSVNIFSQKKITQWDSVCYALGLTWRNDLSQFKLRIKPGLFFKGIKDSYKKDTTFFTTSKAQIYLEKQENNFSNPFATSSALDSISYAIGFLWAKNIYAAGFPLPDSSYIIMGLNEELPSLMTSATAKKILKQYLEEIRENEFRGIKLMNENWLNENKKQSNIITLPNGVQYKIIRPSVNGSIPSDTNIFVINYKAKLIDGTIFAQSQGKEKFYLSALIPGLHQVLRSMRTGEIREVYIPYYLAYGSGGIKDVVPPFATVIYEIELVDLK